jgi:hypothetical protein
MIFVHLRAGVRMNRAFLETLENPGALLVFYDWEANVLTPSGRPVAGLLRSGSPQALQISQGAATAGPGSPGAGSMTLFRAVTLASAQSEISAAQCAQQHCSRLGPEYFAFALPGTAGCAAGSPCYLAGPASSPSDLRTKLPPGVSLSHVQTVQIPQGTVILRAVASRGFGHAPPWSDPSAQYFVLRDRASLFGNEITNPRQSVDQSGAPDVTFGFTSKGSSAFQQATRRIAVRGSQVSLFGQSYLQHFAIAVGTQLISVPSIDFHVYPDGVSGAGGADITGGFTVRSARKLASQLRVPPLPVTLELLSVSPAAGAKSPAHVGAQLVSTDCMGNGGGGRTVIQSCHFILSNGQRFRCDHQLKGEPTNREINAAGCVPLRPLVLSSRQKALIVQIFTAKQCLATRGLRVVGGPVLPSGRRIPDGEIVVTGRHPTFIAFFIDSAKARRAAGLPAPRGRQVQRHGRVTIVWTWPPSTGLRADVEACVF